MPSPQVHRLAAFVAEPGGGNPAGVVLAGEPLDVDWMQATAKEVGYSETAYLWPAPGTDCWTVRYHSPEAEVPFCGHATLAAGALLAREHGDGTRTLVARPGEVAVTGTASGGRLRAELTSVEPSVRQPPVPFVSEVLSAFGWDQRHLAPMGAPMFASAGAKHLLVPVRTRDVLAAMAYDFDRLRELMLEQDLTTVAILWAETPTRWHARNAFAVGGVVEDPATGAAAAALGGWLRITAQLTPPTKVVVLQGADLGRPSRLEVHVPPSGGITVAGDVVDLD